MTDRPAFLLWPVAVVGLAALFYAVKQHRRSLLVLEQIRDSVQNNAIQTHALHRTLRRQRGAINDIHRYLLPVSKGSEKTTR
jgi:hypothetical protein